MGAQLDAHASRWGHAPPALPPPPPLPPPLVRRRSRLGWAGRSPCSPHAAAQQPAARLRRLEPNGGPSGSISCDRSPAGRRACPSAPSWLLHSCCRCRAAPRSAPRFKLSLTAATAGMRLLSRANQSGKRVQCNWMAGCDAAGAGGLVGCHGGPMQAVGARQGRQHCSADQSTTALSPYIAIHPAYVSLPPVASAPAPPLPLPTATQLQQCSKT